MFSTDCRLFRRTHLREDPDQLSRLLFGQRGERSEPGGAECEGCPIDERSSGFGDADEQDSSIRRVLLTLDQSHLLELVDEVRHARSMHHQQIAQPHRGQTTRPRERQEQQDLIAGQVEPERPQDMLSTLEWIGVDRVMFSTDYPHWDQDDPRYAFKVKLSDDWSRMIYRENARALYRLD